MKKDIIIPEVENVFMAVVQEWSDEFMEKVWYAYLVNDSDFQLDGVMVVSKAFGTIDGEMKKTSLLRHAFAEIPEVSVAKIELIEKSVLALNNEFMVTFFYWEHLVRQEIYFQSQFDSRIQSRRSAHFICRWRNCSLIIFLLCVF